MPFETLSSAGWSWNGDGLPCTDLTAQLDTKVVITPRTTLAHIRLTCTLFADDKQPCALTDRLHGVLEDNPRVPILHVPPHANDMDDVVQACNGKANPSLNKTQQRHVEREGTRLLFAAQEPTTKKAGKDKCPFKHPHLNTLRNVVDSKPAIALPNYSLTSRSPYCWKPELVGLTTPGLMESEDLVLSIPMCDALPLMWTSGPVKQVDIFRKVYKDVSHLGQTWQVSKEEVLAKNGEMLANMKIEVNTVGQKRGSIFNVAWPSPNRPPDPGDRAAVYTVILTGNGGQDEGLQHPHVVLWAQRVLQGLFLVKVGYVRATLGLQQLWHQDLQLELQNVGVEHGFSSLMPVNLDCSVEGRENMFVYRCGSGVPLPWQEVSISMLAGDLWTLRSYLIHRGGAVPRGAPAGSTCIIAFAAIATRRVDYKTTVPIILPPWVGAATQPPLPLLPKAVRCPAARRKCLVKAAPLQKCFACDNSCPCAVHVGQLCTYCQLYVAEDALVVDKAPAQCEQ